MKLIKNNVVFGSIIVSIILVSAIITANINIFASTNNLSQKAVDGKYLSNEEVSKLMDNEEVKMKRENKETRLDNIWDEIKTLYNIDERDYIKVTLEDIHKGKLKEKSAIFNDEKFLSDFNSAYNEFNSELKKGSSMPNLLVKKDKSEILYVFKDGEGNDILLAKKAVASGWEVTKESKKGKKM